MKTVVELPKHYKNFRRRLKSGGFVLTKDEHLEEAKKGIRKIAHIHMHSIYSIADAMCKPDEVAKRAKELGIDTIVLTDHGVISGVIQMKKACDKYGIKFIPACEMYEAPGGRFGDRTQPTPSKTRRENRHITMIPVNNEGWGAMQYLIQDANTNGMYYDPRTDMNFIKEHGLGKNIIATSGCLGGEIPQRILAGDIEGAKEEALFRAEIFHTFFLEIQDNGSREQEIVNQVLIDIAKETKLPLIYAKDVHYVLPEHADPHHTLVTIGRSRGQKKLTVYECERYPGTNTYHFAGPTEVYEWAISNKIPLEAIENTVKVTDMCNVEIELGKKLMPEYEFCEKGHTPETYLRKLLYDNLIEYVKQCAQEGKKIDVKQYIERIEYEYQVITSKNVASYFLILWDILLWSRDRKKWKSYPANAEWLAKPENQKYEFYPEYFLGPGRGSAAGSMIAFLLDITRLDPIEYGLLFERFLNPDRKGLPDVDCDFPGDNHELMLDFVAQRYGRDRVAQVKTFTFFKLKGAIDSICSALEMKDPNDKRKTIAYGRKVAEEVKEAINMIATETGKMPDQSEVTYHDMMNISINPDDYKRYDSALDRAIEASKEFRRLMEKYPELNENLKAIEGTISTSGIHAGAVIISKRPLIMDCPTLIPDEKSKAVLPITMFDYPDCEEIGLLKMDLLRVSTLKQISETLRLIQERHNKKIDLYKIGRNDKNVFKYISEGNTFGMFQINGGGITNYTMQVKPTQQSDLIDIAAIYRPGPLDAILENGKTIAEQYVINGDKTKLKKYLKEMDEDIREILKISRGQMIYQEQTMMISRVVAGYSRGQADGFRKVISKKKISEIKKQYDTFVFGHEDALSYWKEALNAWDSSKKVINDKGVEAILWYDRYAQREIPITKEELEEKIADIEEDMKFNVIPGAIKNGYEEKFADNLFRQIEAFGGYGFNRSHSACYADESYQTAWLKYYYPTEFMAALFTVRGDNKEDVLAGLKEAKRMGLKILPPHINKSDIGFFPEADGIRFGLRSIDGVGLKAVEYIIEMRKQKGDFKDFDDFLEKVVNQFQKTEERKTNPINRSVIRQLIKAGCFDEFEPNRYKLLNYYNFNIRGDKKWDGSEEELEKEKTAKSNHSVYYDPKQYNEKRMLQMEYELIGIYVTKSPYEGLPYTPLSDMELSTRRDKILYDVGGRISKIRTIKTKKGDPMAFIEIETQLEPIEITVFPDEYEKYEQHLYKDNIIVIRGYKERSYYGGKERENFICQKILVKDAKKLKKEMGIQAEKPIEKEEEKELPIIEQSKPEPKQDPVAELFNEEKPKKKKKRKPMETIADYL